MDDPRRIVSVAVTSTGETGFPLDAHGEATYESIAWFDGRTKAEAQWLDERIGANRLFTITGLSLQPIFSLCKILWLRKHAPEAYARTVRWLNAADFIAFRLCGVAATDRSLASRMLMLNLHEMRWATELLDEVDIPHDLLPPAAQRHAAAGTNHRRSGGPDRPAPRPLSASAATITYAAHSQLASPSPATC